VKGGDDFDRDALGSADTRHWSIPLVPVCGIEDIARRGVRLFGFYLASSSLAPDIANITASLFRLL
jgi:hypothetical protein